MKVVQELRSEDVVECGKGEKVRAGEKRKRKNPTVAKVEQQRRMH